MIRPAVEHPNEPLNRRSLLLRLRRTIWLVPAAGVVGALLGALIYSLLWLSVSGQRQYSQTSKYYLTFGYEENGEVADYYNAYTWNDLLFSIPAISDVIEDELPDGVTMEEAREAIEADILSDVRVLTIEVTHSDPSVVQQLTNAVEDALVRYGKNAIQFENIEFLSSDEVEAVVISDRTCNAVLLGAALGLLVSAVWLWIHTVLDDGIYVPEDSVRRYGLPVRVTSAAEGTELPGFLRAESADALACWEAAGALRLVSPAEETARQAAEQLKDRFGWTGGTLFSQDRSDGRPVGKDASSGTSVPVLLVIPYGRANGTRTEHLIEQLRAEGTEIDAVFLMNADGRFLTAYYGKEKRSQFHGKAKTGSGGAGRGGPAE